MIILPNLENPRTTSMNLEYFTASRDIKDDIIHSLYFTDGEVEYQSGEPDAPFDRGN